MEAASSSKAISSSVNQDLAKENAISKNNEDSFVDVNSTKEEVSK